MAAGSGERLRMSVPHGHWKTRTFIAGLRNAGIIAPLAIGSPVSREVFETWVERVSYRSCMHATSS